MTYQESMEYMEELSKKIGSSYSITEAAALSEAAGRPERRLQVIHIAGTNGKGSVSNYISNILAMSGYRVGKYISPTLMDYREKIQRVEKKGEESAAEWISEDMTAELLSCLRGLCEKMVERGYSQPSAFEVETVMAFLAFEAWNVDYAVVETGLGGMMDATNIIERPLQCVITSLSLEHQQILGNSLTKIAKEKYGIIKKNAQVISAEQDDCVELLKSQVQRKKAVLFWVDRQMVQGVQFSTEKTAFTYRGIPYELKQLGTYQLDNALLAIESAWRLKEIGAAWVTRETIQSGLLISRWKGRFEQISKHPYIIADGAHNPDAAKRLAESLQMYFAGEPLDFIFGVLRDKDYQQMIGHLLPLMHHVYTVTPPVERGLSAENLKKAILEMAEPLGKGKENALEVTTCKTVEDAVEAVQGTERKVCVCGSLFLMGEVYRLLEK